MSRESDEIAATLVAAWLKATHAFNQWIPALDDLQGRIATALDDSWKQGQADQEMHDRLASIFGHAAAILGLSSQEAGGR